MIDLIEELAKYSDKPYEFCLWGFPWGEPGSELADYPEGPNEWQTLILKLLGDNLISFAQAIQMAEDTATMQLGVTSGHGIGKSAFVAMLILWAISTMEDTKGVVTANTENQLKTKTWAELAKWHRLFIARDLFKMTATKLYSADPAHENTWRIDMVPWSEKNQEAFAGLHNKGKRILLVFDEASNIPDVIWEVAEGAMTDENTQIIWAVFGNPTRSAGRFRDCFAGGKFAHRWQTTKVDSRTVSITNKKRINEWVEDYGEDHDFVRIRVRGEFPRSSAESFIPRGDVEAAIIRDISDQSHLPVILGVDVARYGGDSTVLYARQGRDAATRTPRVFKGLSTMEVVREVIKAINDWDIAFTFVDAGNYGGGVVDRLIELRVPVMGVEFGAGMQGFNTETSEVYANVRAEIWGCMRAWLKRGSINESIPRLDTTFLEELVAPQYVYVGKREAIQLEKKKDMKNRGVASPDAADALALTFAYPDLASAAAMDFANDNDDDNTDWDYDPLTRGV